MAADGYDVAVVQAQVLDETNRLVPIADVPVEFHLSGQGKVIGVGNGNPSDLDADRAERRRAFNGLCMAIVQSTREAGELRLEATSPGIRAAAITFNSYAANGRL
jgi:beta-galactosidase